MKNRLTLIQNESAQWSFDTAVGTLFLVASDKGLQSLHWHKQSVPMLSALGSDTRSKILAKAEKQLMEYFAGKRKEFDIPLDLKGTPFQKKVWSALSRIPYGKTVSYQEIAKKIRNDKACRAVGTANGRNPVAIIVPCHRVIAADGRLGGYSSGLSIKTKLLGLEIPGKAF